MHHPHHNGFVREDPWRIFRIMAEFVDSFETLSHLGPSVTVFGSARFRDGHPFYELGQAVGLVNGGGSHRPHFVNGDVDAGVRRLPGGFAAGEAAADNVNGCGDALWGGA